MIENIERWRNIAISKCSKCTYSIHRRWAVYLICTCREDSITGNLNIVYTRSILSNCSIFFFLISFFYKIVFVMSQNDSTDKRWTEFVFHFIVFTYPGSEGVIRNPVMSENWSMTYVLKVYK